MDLRKIDRGAYVAVAIAIVALTLFAGIALGVYSIQLPAEDKKDFIDSITGFGVLASAVIASMTLFVSVIYNKQMQDIHNKEIDAANARHADQLEEEKNRYLDQRNREQAKIEMEHSRREMEDILSEIQSSLPVEREKSSEYFLILVFDKYVYRTDVSVVGLAGWYFRDVLRGIFKPEDALNALNRPIMLAGQPTYTEHAIDHLNNSKTNFIKELSDQFKNLIIEQQIGIELVERYPNEFRSQPLLNHVRDLMKIYEDSKAITRSKVIRRRVKKLLTDNDIYEFNNSISTENYADPENVIVRQEYERYRKPLPEDTGYFFASIWRVSGRDERRHLSSIIYRPVD